MLPLSHFNKPAAGALALAAALCFPFLAHADTTIYKWIDKNGAVSYSQDPPKDKDAKNVTSFTVESLPPSQQKAANRMLSNLQKSEDAEFAERQKRMKEADHKVDVALRRLDEAERHLAVGSTPTGNDRIGIGDGHARLRDSYFTRVQDLQNQVDAAQQALNDAYDARNKLQRP
jgi:hypothetical protein